MRRQCLSILTSFFPFTFSDGKGKHSVKIAPDGDKKIALSHSLSLSVPSLPSEKAIKQPFSVKYISKCGRQTAYCVLLHNLTNGRTRREQFTILRQKHLFTLCLSFDACCTVERKKTTFWNNVLITANFVVHVLDMWASDIKTVIRDTNVTWPTHHPYNVMNCQYAEYKGVNKDIARIARKRFARGNFFSFLNLAKTYFSEVHYNTTCCTFWKTYQHFKVYMQCKTVSNGRGAFSRNNFLQLCNSLVTWHWSLCTCKNVNGVFLQREKYRNATCHNCIKITVTKFNQLN